MNIKALLKIEETLFKTKLMLKKVRVIVKVQDSELTITCGDGKQTFKWLALVIQTKIKDDSNLRKRFDVNSFIVSEIRNIFGELLNPNDLIEEHAGPSGLSVNAVLSSKFPLDQWENPQLGAWYKSAYVKSDVGKYWNSELDAWRSSVQEIDDTSKQNEEKKRTHFIQVGFDFSADDVNTAFEFDAKNMKWDWITGDTNISRIMDVLRVNYLLICNIFAHFCGVGQGTVIITKTISVYFYRSFIHHSWRKVRSIIVGIRPLPSLSETFQLQNGQRYYWYTYLLNINYCIRY